MGYCTIADVSKIMGGDLALAEASCDESPPEIDTVYVQSLIDAKGEYIDNYLRSIYTLPLINTHYILNDICCNLVQYELYKRRNREKLLEPTLSLYLNDLDKLRAGKILLYETENPQTGTEGKFKTNKKNTEKDFPDEFLNNLLGTKTGQFP